MLFKECTITTKRSIMYESDKIVELTNCSNNLKKRAYTAKCDIKEGTTLLVSKGVVLKDNVPNKLLKKVSTASREAVKSFHLFWEAINTAKMAKLKNEIYTTLYPTEAELEEISEEEKLEAAFVVASYLRAIRQDLCKEAMVRLYLVMKYNVMRINQDFNLTFDKSGIFPSASFLNHSCWPNCIGFYSSVNDAFVVRSIQPIPAGTQLTISYISIFFSKSTRAGDLKSAVHFLQHCECPRCTSADLFLSNVDAYLEGFDCPSDGCKGQITQSDEETGACRTCKTSFPWKSYSQFLLTFSQCLELLEEWPYATQIDVISTLKREAIERKMHRCHSFLVHLHCKEARIRGKHIALQTKRHPNTPMTEELNELTELSQLIFRITNIISPKYHPVRTQYLLNLSTVYKSLGNFDKAKTYETQARTIATVCYGQVNAHSLVKNYV